VDQNHLVADQKPSIYIVPYISR